MRKNRGQLPILFGKPYAYDDFQRFETVTDPIGKVITCEYDATDRVT